MAIFESTGSTDGQAGEPASQPQAVAGEPASSAPARPDEITPEAITAPHGSAQAVAAPAQSAASNLPAALEPELRRIIDTAVARVAAIELEAIREARELTQRSEQEARDALKFALDRAFNLINSLELLASTVNGMAEALKVELDDAITALRNVPEPESELSRELAGREEPAPAAPQPEPVAVEPQPEPAPEAGPASEPEPAPAASEPEPPAEPRIKLTPIVRPAEVPATSDEEQPAEAEPERELVTVGVAPPPSAKHKSQPPHSRKGRVRRFFTR